MRRQRKADQGRGGRAAEDDDEGVHVEEHPQIAAHQDQGDENDAAERQARGRLTISMEHSNTQRTRRDPAIALAEP